MDRAQDWLSNTDACWHADTKTWEFPSGATLTFGYLQTERDKYRYQGAAFQMIGFDEITQFTESMYQYLFSRLRRLDNSYIPIRMRAASNPGDIGHEWVKRRWIVQTAEQLHKQKRFFVPAFLEDNPHLDRGAYGDALDKLDPVTREQLRYGNWDIAVAGGMFERGWFEIVDSVPVGGCVRAWDMAATKVGKNKDPDWTAGVLMVKTDTGTFCIADVVRFQKRPGDTEKIIKQTADIDGITTNIVMEQEPGASGVIMIDHYARGVLDGFSFEGINSTGSKSVRAQPFSAACSNGNMSIVHGAWNSALLSELEPFPQIGIHDDQVDSCALAFNVLNKKRTGGFLAAHGGANRR